MRKKYAFSTTHAFPRTLVAWPLASSRRLQFFLNEVQPVLLNSKQKKRIKEFAQYFKEAQPLLGDGDVRLLLWGDASVQSFLRVDRASLYVCFLDFTFIRVCLSARFCSLCSLSAHSDHFASLSLCSLSARVCCKHAATPTGKQSPRCN
jgi:hypothetical protein